MARTVRNAKIDTRSSRSRLVERREPYWTVVSRGCGIGYRRGAKGGTWIARCRDDRGKQHYEALGAADDAREADGQTVFTFSQAQELARKFFARAARREDGEETAVAGPATVKQALDDYFAARERRGSKSVSADRYAAEARIVPELGSVVVEKLSAKKLRSWHAAVAAAPKLLRTAKSATKRATKAVDEADTEALCARRSTSNRLLTVLKAALNHSYHEGLVASDEAWRKVKPFREVDAAVVRFLTEAECKRLVNTCGECFCDLVRGALLTGCRYGELIRMTTADFNVSARTITVRQSKAGKPRHVTLTDEGGLLFASLTAGSKQRDLIFRRSDGSSWKASHQQRPLSEASERAKIDPPATFHVLQHTYASALAMRGVPMGVIAAQLGHADTRMTEKHYAHLTPSYVSQTIRASLPSDAVKTTGSPGRRGISGWYLAAGATS